MLCTILAFLLCVPSAAQTKLSHWDESLIHYAVIDSATGTKASTSLSATLSGVIVVPYHILISDVDGDRCPFTPTCSAFLMDACNQTNIFQGALMFFDRFTRDSNVFDRDEHYPVAKKRHRYIDPASNYRLRDSLIIIVPVK